MSYILAVVLLALWLVAMVGSYTLGGIIHILPAMALVAILLAALRGKQTL